MVSRLAGIVCLNKKSPTKEHYLKVKEMCELQVHRESKNLNVLTIGSACVGIVDISTTPESNGIIQKKNSNDESCLTLFSGTLYNFGDSYTNQRGQEDYLKSQSDAEKVSNAFLGGGDESFTRLVGIFAFVVYNTTNGTCYLVRDKFGEKPLYYTISDRTLYFASELPALIKILPTVRLNRQSILEWSLYRNLATSQTFIEDIFAVPPGHFVKVYNSRVDVIAYSSPIDYIDRDTYERLLCKPEETVVENVEAALLKSVKDCVTGSDNIGTFCSGGVDSSLITAMASSHISDMKAFHASAHDYSALDERHYAEKVTKALNLQLECCPINKNIFHQELLQVIYLNGMPLTHIHLVPFALITRLAKEKGVSVLLTGDAADGQFGGLWYRQRRQKQLFLVKKLFKRLPRRVRNALGLASGLHSGLTMTTVGLEQLIPSLVQSVDKYTRMEWRSQIEQAYDFVTNPVDRSILATMVEDFIDSWDLDRADRLGVAAGVECRSPFAHPDVVKLSFNLPLQYRFRWRTDKWLLKKIAIHYLDHDIVYCKKRPWDFPWKEYLSPFATPSFFRNGFCTDALGLSKLTIQEFIKEWEKNIKVFWNLINLEIWGRLFFRHEPLEQLTSLFLSAKRSK